MCYTHYLQAAASSVPPGSMQSLWSCDASVTPRVGDVAKRGPNWRWGDQDCGEQEIGLVVHCSLWSTAASQQQQQQSDTGLAVSVMWKDGSRNVYRWGVHQQYDITVLQRRAEAPATAAAADATRSSKSTAAAGTASTTAAATTTSAATIATTAAAADEHAQAAALPSLLTLLLQAVDAMHTTSTAHSAAKGAASGEQAVQHSSTCEALAAAQVLLERMQLLLTADGSAATATTAAAAAAVSTDKPETAASSDEFVGASGQRRRWNWSDCSHSVPALLDADTAADGSDAATAAAATAAAAAAEVDLTLDPAHCFTNLQCTSGREPAFSCTVQQGADRGWGVALTTIGWARFTGVHTWMVHLDSVR
jgi:Mib_herc2